MPKNCQLGPVLSYGSEGTVHCGTWHGSPAAIKVLLNHYARRAETEMKLVMNFNHINIIKYFDLEYEQGTAYLSMDYINGGNLYEFIQTKFNSSLYWTTISQILIDVARGMVYLHDRNIVQGDLKSHNILLRNDSYQAVICDFGISRSLENDVQVKKRYSSAKGTIRWMAPEICTPPPEQSSFESDVWSYGCMILEITSGREPWINQFNDDAILFRALQRKENAPVFARICANESGPPDICKLLIQCCSWFKADRPRFADILNNFDPVHDESLSYNDNTEQMSIDTPISHDRSYSEEDYTKFHDKSTFDEDENTRTRPTHPFQIRKLVNNSEQVSAKSNRHQGRLTGDLYTSNGSASGRPIYEGVKGGHYYLTASGSKVYLHK